MKDMNLIKTVNVKGKEFDYIPQFSIVGYENETEGIDIIVKNIYNEEEARIYAKTALEVLESGMIEFTSKHHQFHLTKEELKDMEEKRIRKKNINRMEELVNDFIQGMGESLETKHIEFLKQAIEITNLTQEEKCNLIDKLDIANK